MPTPTHAPPQRPPAAPGAGLAAAGTAAAARCAAAVRDCGGRALAPAGHRLMELDLRSGAQRRLAAVPGAASGVAVAGPHLYVPDPAGGAVLVLDRRSGDLVARVRVGRRPASVLAVGPAGYGSRTGAPLLTW